MAKVVKGIDIRGLMAQFLDEAMVNMSPANKLMHPDSTLRTNSLLKSEYLSPNIIKKYSGKTATIATIGANNINNPICINKNFFKRTFLSSGRRANRGITRVTNKTLKRLRIIDNLPNAPICATAVVLPNIEINQIVSCPDKL